MNELELFLRQVIRDEMRTVLEEMLPQFQPRQVVASSEPEDALLLSTREAAKRLSISERTLFELTKSGQLPCVRLGLAKRYSVEAIKNWIQKAETEPDRHSISWPQRANADSTSRPSSRSKAAKRTVKNSQKKKPKPHSGPQAIPTPTDSEKRNTEEQLQNPMALLLSEIGVDYAVASEMTNGELMQIAGVDVSIYHGWRFLGRSMPEEALEKLREYFRAFKKQEEASVLDGELPPKPPRR